MKIVERGNNHKWWDLRVGTCYTCKTKIMFEDADTVTKHEALDQRDADTVSQPCPVCGKSISVSPHSTKLTEEDRIKLVHKQAADALRVADKPSHT